MKCRQACTLIQGEFFKVKNPLFQVCATSQTTPFFLILLVFMFFCLFITKLLFLNAARIQRYFAHGLNTKLYILPLWYDSAPPRKRKHTTIKVFHFITFLKILLKSSHSLFLRCFSFSADRSRLSFIPVLQSPACRLQFLQPLSQLLYRTPRRIIILLYCGWHLSLVLTYIAVGGGEELNVLFILSDTAQPRRLCCDSIDLQS